MAAINDTVGTVGIAGDLVPPINAAFTRRFLEVARFFTHYFNGTNPAQIFSHGGTKTALWRRYENLDPTTTPLAELTSDAFPTRPSSLATVTDVTQAIDKYGDYLMLNEEADVFNFNGQTAELLDRLAEQAGRSFNLVTRNDMEGGGTVARAGGVTLDTDIITGVVAADLDRIINLLARGTATQSGTAGGLIKPARTFFMMTEGSENVGTLPILSSYYGICHPDVSFDISKLAGFSSVDTYNSQIQVMPNEIGIYKGSGVGIRLVETADASIEADGGGVAATNSLRTTGATNADLYRTVIYGRDAVGTVSLDNDLPDVTMTAQDFGGSEPAIELISKPLGSAGASDALNELATLGWKGWDASAVLEGSWIFVLTSGATAI